MVKIPSVTKFWPPSVIISILWNDESEVKMKWIHLQSWIWNVQTISRNRVLYLIRKHAALKSQTFHHDSRRSAMPITLLSGYHIDKAPESDHLWQLPIHELHGNVTGETILFILLTLTMWQYVTTKHSHSVVFRKRAGQRLAAEHSGAFRRHSYVNVTLRLHNVVRLVVRKIL